MCVAQLDLLTLGSRMQLLAPEFWCFSVAKPLWMQHGCNMDDGEKMMPCRKFVCHFKLGCVKAEDSYLGLVDGARQHKLD